MNAATAAGNQASKKMLSPFDLLSLSLVSDEALEQKENSTAKKTEVKVRVKANKGQEWRDREIQGKLLSFDDHLNLMLLDCTETIYRLKSVEDHNDN